MIRPRSSTTAAARLACEELTLADCITIIRDISSRPWIKGAAERHADLAMLGEVDRITVPEDKGMLVNYWYTRRVLIGTPEGRCAIVSLMPLVDRDGWCMAVVSDGSPREALTV